MEEHVLMKVMALCATVPVASLGSNVILKVHFYFHGLLHHIFLEIACHSIQLTGCACMYSVTLPSSGVAEVGDRSDYVSV